MAEPRIVCSECDRSERIDDIFDMPSFYCPNCGGRRHVEIDAENPAETQSDKI